jgi:hypothetical protein
VIHPDFTPSLHPRGPNGRFTRSFAHKAGPAQQKHGHDLAARFSPTKGSPLAGISGDKAAVQQFTANHTAINTTLRAGGADTPEITALDRAMKALPHDTTLVRAVPLSQFGNVKPGALTGFVVRDAGFFPTSAHPPGQNAAGSVLMRIQAPAGTRAAVDPDSGQVVLDRGTEMLVQGVRDTPNGPEMALTVLPAEGAHPEPANPPTTGAAGKAEPPSAPQPDVAPATPTPPVPEHAQPYHQTLTGLEGLADRIESQGVAERHTLAAGEVGEVERIVLDDGTEVFFKQNTDWDDDRTAEVATDAEQLAAQLGGVLGAPVPRVYRTGADTMYTDWAQGRSSIEFWTNPMAARMDRPPDNDVVRGLVESPAGRRLGLMDVLTHNTDRHPGNWLVGDGGQITGIDHGMAWMDGVTADGLSDQEFLQAARADMRGPFMLGFFDEAHFDETDEVRLRDLDFLSAGDVAEMRQRLEALRPEFERLGRGGWLDYSQRMLSLIEPHATGTGSIFDG